MNDPKNVLIGKIGKTVQFKKCVVSTGGDAPVIFYTMIAKMNPEYTFYFIGPNDLHKLSAKEYEMLFPAKNVKSAYKKGDDYLSSYNSIFEYFKENNITPNFALLFNGLCGSTNIPNYTPKVDGSGIAKIMQAFEKYSGPYINALNKIGCPFYLISEDARYITVMARDIINQPRLIFTQTNGEFETMKHRKADDDPTLVPGEKLKAIYAGTEKIFLMGLGKDWQDRIHPENKVNLDGEKVIILSNGCGTSKINHPGDNASRLPEYKKWIFDNFKGTSYKNTKIYGSWAKEIYEEYPQIIDKKIYELGDEIDKAKYTLCYSQVPGFVTNKAWEMICLGLIPFLHPDYDKDHLLNLPDYLYLKDPKEFLDKINELESDPEKYICLMTSLVEYIKPAWVNGKALNNYILGKIAEDMGFKYEKKNGLDFDDKLVFGRFNKNPLELK